MQLQMALAEMGIERDKAAIFSGIGCSGKTSHYINTLWSSYSCMVEF